MRPILRLGAVVCVAATFACQIAHEPALAITTLAWAVLLVFIAGEFPSPPTERDSNG